MNDVRSWATWCMIRCVALLAISLPYFAIHRCIAHSPKQMDIPSTIVYASNNCGCAFVQSPHQCKGGDQICVIILCPKTKSVIIFGKINSMCCQE